MQSYLIYSHVKVFVKPQQNPFDVIKTTNIGVCHYQQKPILPSGVFIHSSRKIISVTADL